MKKGPLGILPAVRHTVVGPDGPPAAPSAGSIAWLALLVPVALFALLADDRRGRLALLLRHGGLLLHDLEESFGPDAQPPGPMVVFVRDPAPAGGHVPGLGLAAALVAGPALHLPVARPSGSWWRWLSCWRPGRGSRWCAASRRASWPQQNPLFVRRACSALEGGADARADRPARGARRANPTTATSATCWRPSTRRPDATTTRPRSTASCCDRGRATRSRSTTSRNLEFAAGEFRRRSRATSRGSRPGPPPPWRRRSTTTCRWPTCSGSSTSRRRRRGRRPTAWTGALIQHVRRHVEVRQGRLRGGGPRASSSGRAVGASSAAARRASARKNVAGQGAAAAEAAGSLAQPGNRFAGFLALFALVVVGAVALARGARMFTMRCLKCGTPFCRRCHLGRRAGRASARSATTCSWCATACPARRATRSCSRCRRRTSGASASSASSRSSSPGAGHVYAQRTLGGLLFVLVWSARAVAGRCWPGACCPSPRPPAALTPPWGLGAGGRWCCWSVYVAANRARPDFEVVMPARRGRRAAARAA